jgi:cytochrome b561
MGFQWSRLRWSEIVAGVAALVLLASMFVLPWYGYKGDLAPLAARLGVSTSRDAWNSLSTTRWLMLLTIVAALALVYLQGTRPSPALPATFSLFVTLLGGLTAVVLMYRVLINMPGPNDVVSRDVGGFVGLLASIVIAFAGYRSLREEGIAPQDAPKDIPTVHLDEAAVGTPS